jgi:beta-1,4-N-acetylglucosaminyltransferase
VWKLRPGLIICNGPGTCVLLCYAAFLLRLLGVYQPVLVFAESFCRVSSLSLSGKLLYPIVDKFVVQWPGLADRYSRAEYLGRIC